MFFNPLASADPNYKVLATAQMTITDQTDASNLAGNITIVNGSKSQTYLTGSNQPYSPNWKVNNLVIRPYMIATNIFKGSNDSRYNPDLFDPKEYPNLESPGDPNISTKYIHDIQWYMVDSANNQTEINVSSPEFSSKFSHTWTYPNGDSSIALSDKRTLVIKDNILEKDSIASILVKFSFHDPFADIRIPVAYEIQINNISTGMGTSKAAINSIDGNSFYNAGDDEKLRLEATYYNEGVYVDLNKLLSQGSSNLKVEWFIKSQLGWSLLDSTTQDSNSFNEFYEIHRIVEKDELGNITKTEKTTNAKGGVLLIIKPGLIAGSDIIKLTITDDTMSDAQANALESIYDYSDPTQCRIHSSNGDKLYKGMDAPGTILSAVITYKGELLESSDDRYNTMFDYYWYRVDSRGDVIENMYIESDVLKFMNTKDPQYTPENEFPRTLAKSVDIEPIHVENKATFTCDILDKKRTVLYMNRNALLKSLPSEDEVRDAETIIQNAGLNKYDHNSVIETATEMRAFAVAQEYNILNRGE